MTKLLRWLVAPLLLSAGDEGVCANRRGSFLVIGDWGWDSRVHGNIRSRACQGAVAEQMARVARELGDVKFVVNVGDSFYPNGVRSRDDSQWDKKWREVYARELLAVPWYSVYGNHDLMSDPCACDASRRACAQVNQNPGDRSRFYMPDVSWHLELPELDLEVVALELNHLWAEQTCFRTRCQDQCKANLRAWKNDALALLRRRTAESTARNLIVFSHYPTDYLRRYPEVLQQLRNTSGGRRHVEYFGGHRHNVDQRSTESIAPNGNWLSGGGGGWSCDGRQQGFVVGEIPEDGPVTTRAVLVDAGVCCR